MYYCGNHLCLPIFLGLLTLDNGRIKLPWKLVMVIWLLWQMKYVTLVSSRWKPLRADAPLPLTSWTLRSWLKNCTPPLRISQRWGSGVLKGALSSTQKRCTPGVAVTDWIKPNPTKFYPYLMWSSAHHHREKRSEERTNPATTLQPKRSLYGPLYSQKV